MRHHDQGWKQCNFDDPPFSALDALAFVLALFGIVGLILIVGW